MAFKASFTISDKEIFRKLHISAGTQAIRKFRPLKLFNTAFPEKEEFTSSKDGTYSVGVLVEFDDYQNPNLASAFGSTATRLEEANKKAKDKLLDGVHRCLHEYFVWFAGKKLAQNVTKQSLIEFPVDQKLDEVPIKNADIVVPSSLQKAMDKYRKENDGAAPTAPDMGSSKDPPKLAFKVIYSLTI